jgi:hypothetical protein
MVFARIDSIHTRHLLPRGGLLSESWNFLCSPLFSPLFLLSLPLASYLYLPFEMGILFLQRLSVAAEKTPQKGKVRLGGIAIYDALDKVHWQHTLREMSG